MLLAEKEIVREAWNTLKTMHMGTERVKEEKVQTLKSEFEVLHMNQGESIDDFAVKLTTIVNKIRALDNKVEEATLSRNFFEAIPPKFLQIASTIEQFGDLKMMTVEEEIGSLKAHEECIDSYGKGGGGKEHLLLTRAKWLAREKKTEGGSSTAVKNNV